MNTPEPNPPEPVAPKKHKKKYDDSFTYYKEKNLFPNDIPFLHELKQWWDHYSEWGTMHWR